MKTEEKKLKLEQIIRIEKAVNILDNTDQYLPLTEKIRLARSKSSLSLITKEYYEAVKEIREKLIKELSIDEKSSNLKISEFEEEVKKELLDDLKKEHEVIIPIFKENEFEDWNKKAEVKKKEFNPPILFFELIDFLIEE